MKMEKVFRCLGYSIALVLIQTIDNGESVFCRYDEFGDFVCRTPTASEKIVLSAKYFAAFANNAVYFGQSLSRMFEKMFIEQQNAAVENLSILSDMYNYGSLITDNLLEIMYLFAGQHEFPTN